MEFFTTTDLSNKASSSIRNRAYGLYESAGAILAKQATAFDSYKTYDIFLSHSFLDAAVIYGLKTVLEENGYSTYVYWLEEKPTAKSEVTSETADGLRKRMKTCKSLLYATSENAENSKWMPWELGYFDGIRQKIAVCPITYNSSFVGREYLGLYPIVEKDFWLHKDGKLFKRMRSWIDEN